MTSSQPCANILPATVSTSPCNDEYVTSSSAVRSRAVRRTPRDLFNGCSATAAFPSIQHVATTRISSKREAATPLPQSAWRMRLGAYASGARAWRSRTPRVGTTLLFCLPKCRVFSSRSHPASYLVLCSQCQRKFPDIAQNLPMPELFQAPAPSSAFFYPSAPTVALATGPPSYPYLRFHNF